MAIVFQSTYNFAAEKPLMTAFRGKTEHFYRILGQILFQGHMESC
jgi:hypothetical protein